MQSVLLQSQEETVKILSFAIPSIPFFLQRLPSASPNPNYPRKKKFEQTSATDGQELDVLVRTAMANEKRKETAEEMHQNLADENVATSFEPPMDWTLCTRLWFTSDQTFDWCSTLSSSEESIGLAEFTRGEKPHLSAKEEVRYLSAAVAV